MREGKEVAPTDMEDGPQRIIGFMPSNLEKIKNDLLMSLFGMCFFNDL